MAPSARWRPRVAAGRAPIMRRTAVRFGRRGPKIGGLKRVSCLATRVQGSRRVRSASHHLRWSAKTMCCSQFIIPMASGFLERGIGRRPAGRAVGCAEAPQAGLPPGGLPSLTQTGGVAHPRWLAALIWTGANRLVLPLLALHFITGRRFVAYPLHDPLFFVGSAL